MSKHRKSSTLSNEYYYKKYNNIQQIQKAVEVSSETVVNGGNRHDAEVNVVKERETVTRTMIVYQDSFANVVADF